MRIVFGGTVTEGRLNAAEMDRQLCDATRGREADARQEPVDGMSTGQYCVRRKAVADVLCGRKSAHPWLIAV
jgi:hypothetical protein